MERTVWKVPYQFFKLIKSDNELIKLLTLPVCGVKKLSKVPPVRSTFSTYFEDVKEDESNYCQIQTSIWGEATQKLQAQLASKTRLVKLRVKTRADGEYVFPNDEARSLSIRTGIPPQIMSRHAFTCVSDDLKELIVDLKKKRKKRLLSLTSPDPSIQTKGRHDLASAEKRSKSRSGHHLESNPKSSRSVMSRLSLPPKIETLGRSIGKQKLKKSRRVDHSKTPETSGRALIPKKLSITVPTGRRKPLSHASVVL